MNKMLGAFAFRPLAVLYMLSCINNNELKKQNKTKLKNYIDLFATISVPPIYIIYVDEKLRT